VRRLDRIEPTQSLLAGTEDLPRPVDDGAADHLPGRAMPITALLGTDGARVPLSDLPLGRTVIFVYPRTGKPVRPGSAAVEEIQGERGCTAQLCSVRDAIDDLRRAGAVAVYGLSTQDHAYQSEAVWRLGLPFPLLADPTVSVGRGLRLPTVTDGGSTLYRRLTLVIQDGVIEKVFYPVFPPHTHVDEVISWLRSRRR